VPEGLEAEIWRRACEPLVGRTVEEVVADERVVDDGVVAAMTGATFEGARRRGKVVLLDTDRATIGLHFGMTGRLVVDGDAAIDRLAYASGRDDPAWDRLVVFASPGGRSAPPAIRFNDPRRLGHVSLDPDLDRLGVDFAEVTPRRLARALAGRRGVLKSVLLDQHVVAGLGNLCVDEVLWWAALDPRRTAESLSPAEVERLASTIRRRLPIMLARGGSTSGVLSPAVRASCPPCDRDGAPLERSTIGGRTTVRCPQHQR
jgi:formamidopyrimidine-DNA glycosylase